MSEQHWQNRAACVGVDPELFFPTSRNDSAKSAKKICRNCPVRKECRQAARDNGEEFGVWGGATEQERNGPRPTYTKRDDRGVENVIFVLAQHPYATGAEVAQRLGVERESVNRAVRRSGRTDIREQLNRNAVAAGFAVTSKEKTA
jgi:WhiB family redox-sensing transcriptional regulator